MQIKSLRIKSYLSWRVADTASEQATGWSKAAYYRWLNRYRQRGWAGLESQSRRPKHTRKPQWIKQQEQAVLHLRRRYPLWGKRKLWKILVRDQQMMLSESTVGRIITKFIAKGRIKPASLLLWATQAPAAGV